MALMNQFSGSSGDADKQNRLADTVGEGEGETNGELGTETKASPRVK